MFCISEVAHHVLDIVQWTMYSLFVFLLDHFVQPVKFILVFFTLLLSFGLCHSFRLLLPSSAEHSEAARHRLPQLATCGQISCALNPNVVYCWFLCLLFRLEQISAEAASEWRFIQEVN